MHGVMDCIKIQGFGTFCKICFASGCSVLCFYTHLQVFLGAVGYDFAEKLCEFCCVLCLFVSCFFIVQTYFRISLAECYSGHCQVHTNLGALTLKIGSQIFFDIFRNIGCYANYVLCCPGQILALLDKFLFRCFTDRTDFRCFCSFINISTYAAYKFFHSLSFLSFCCVFNFRISNFVFYNSFLFLILVTVTDITLA